MKRLYARFVLWMIRPAVECALLEEARQGGIRLAERTIIANVGGSLDGKLAARIATLTSTVGRP